MSLVLDRACVRHRDGPPLFAPLSLGVGPGEMATVMGPSGVGKSTLLDAIGGHLAPGFVVSGQITLNNVDVAALPAERRRIGLVFQDALLFPHLSVGDNLAFGLTRSVRGRAARRAAVDEALVQAGLDGMANRDPATLSGGQRARAALMRTILSQPEALLLDEPFGKLDAELRAEMRAFTLSHIRRLGMPALLVTHDPDDAAAAGGPIIALGPGNQI